jgi:glycosyltransferase involved in cell wall biosynthesis
MDNLFVDVILTTYNGRLWIREAIDSVLAQTYPHWHLTIIDDASPEHESNYIEATYGSDERLTVVRFDRNRQVHGARVEAISRTWGDVIAFLDADDRWHPTKLELQMQRLQEKPGVHVVHTDVRHLDQDGRVLSSFADGENRTRASIPYESLDARQLTRELFSENSIRIVSTVVLRDAYARAGGFDLTLGGPADWELWVRLAATGHRFAHLPVALVDKRSHAGQMTRTYRSRLPEKRVLALNKMVAAYPDLLDLADSRRAQFLRQAAVWGFLAADGGRARHAIKDLVRLQGWTVRAVAGWALAWLGPLARPLVRAYVAAAKCH